MTLFALEKALAMLVMPAGLIWLLILAAALVCLRRLREAGQETRALWRSVGIPDDAILPVAEPCWNTRDEIKAYARLQARFGWKRMGLVSSASHLPRAMALAAKAGLAVTPLGADRQGRTQAFQIQELIPQGAGFEINQRACWEYLGRWLGL